MKTHEVALRPRRPLESLSYAELREENAQLRELVVELSRLVVRNVVEPRKHYKKRFASAGSAEPLSQPKLTK